MVAIGICITQNFSARTKATLALSRVARSRAILAVNKLEYDHLHVTIISIVRLLLRLLQKGFENICLSQVHTFMFFHLSVIQCCFLFSYIFCYIVIETNFWAKSTAIRFLSRLSAPLACKIMLIVFMSLIFIFRPSPRHYVFCTASRPLKDAHFLR